MTYLLQDRSTCPSLLLLFITLFIVLHFSELLESKVSIYIITRKSLPALYKLGQATTVEVGLILDICQSIDQILYNVEFCVIH